jgi:chemotaxis protein CheC
MTMPLDPRQTDALKELMNVGVGRAAGILNHMVSSHVQLLVPDITILNLGDLAAKLEEVMAEKVAVVRLRFEGSFSGTAELIFPTESANNLVAVISDEEPGTPDLDSAKTAALMEVGNIVLNSVMGTFANMLKQQLEFHLPTYSEITSDVLGKSGNGKAGEKVIFAQVRFTIRQLEIVGDIILLFEVGSFDTLLSKIDALVDELES